MLDKIKFNLPNSFKCFPILFKTFNCLEAFLQMLAVWVSSFVVVVFFCFFVTWIVLCVFVSTKINLLQIIFSRFTSQDLEVKQSRCMHMVSTISLTPTDYILYAYTYSLLLEICLLWNLYRIYFTYFFWCYFKHIKQEMWYDCPRGSHPPNTKQQTIKLLQVNLRSSMVGNTHTMK